MQNGGENGAAERMCRRKLAGLSEPKWRFSAPQRGALGPQRMTVLEVQLRHYVLSPALDLLLKLLDGVGKRPDRRLGHGSRDRRRESGILAGGARHVA